MNRRVKEDISLCLVRKGDRVLFVRQAYGLRLWTFPGGTVEMGESYPQAAVRELREETGLEGRVDGLVCLRTRADQTVAVFTMEVTGGELLESVPGEIEAVDWLGIESLNNPDIEFFPGVVARKVLAEATVSLQFHAWTGGSGPADIFF